MHWETRALVSLCCVFVRPGELVALAAVVWAKVWLSTLFGGIVGQFV